MSRGRDQTNGGALSGTVSGMDTGSMSRGGRPQLREILIFQNLEKFGKICKNLEKFGKIWKSKIFKKLDPAVSDDGYTHAGVRQ